MQDGKKTKDQKTIRETKLCQRIAELEALETERKRTMEALHSDYEQLKASETLYRTLVDNMDLGISFIDADYTILMTSTAEGKYSNKLMSDVIGKKCFRVFEKRKTVCPHCPGVQAMATGQSTEVDIERVGDDGSRFNARVQAFPVFGDNGTVTGFIKIAENITERKQAEEKLRASEELFRTVFETAQDLIFLKDCDAKYTAINPAMERYFDVSASEFIGKTAATLLGEETDKRSREEELRVLGGEIVDAEHSFAARGNLVVHNVIKVPMRNSTDEIIGLCGIARDITERKRAEDLMNIQHELAVALSAEHDLNAGLRFCVDAAMRVSGMDCGAISLVDEISGALNLVFHEGVSSDFVRSVSHFEADSDHAQLVMAAKPVYYNEYVNLEVPLDEAVKREGLLAAAIIPILFRNQVIGCFNIASHTSIGLPSSARRALETIAAQIGSAIARLQSEEAFRKSKARFRGMVDLLQQTVFEFDEKGNFLFVNAFGFKSFGYTQEDIDKGLNVLQLFIPQDREKIQENIRRILTGQKSHSNEYTAMRKDGGTFPVVVYSSPIIHEGKPAGLRGIVVDITERKQLIEERVNNLERLRRSLEETISALVSTLEARDPYTAGHQKRVANLAVAIAKEMGLADDQIDGIRMASLVHDIGKIYIPSDLLNKSNRLNEAEYELFKSHCQVGYDILKKIDFPWLVAPIVLQHHERQDGSGYPQGLYAEDIILEARILAVADVIEAMSSHRPYRPACSVGDALEEILHHKDSLYDPEVVDACLRVFYDKGFTFEELE